MAVKMTLEEAKKIRGCNGLGYSTIDFIKALQVLEEYYANEKNKEKKEE